MLLGGEAGVGKTRLVTELASRSREADGLVLVGSCLDLTNPALPFGPVVQALRTLQRALDPATLEAVIGPAAEVLERLVPELRVAPTVEPRPAVRCSSTCSACSSASVTACRRCSCSKTCTGPTTRPATSSSSSPATCTTRASMLVGTYRSDDLHRRHPLRAVLAELDRSGVARNASSSSASTAKSCAR